MRSPLPLVAAAIALSSAFASAKVVSFPADKFSLDVPADWVPSPLQPMPPNCRMITAARNPSNGRFYNVLRTDLPSSAAPESFLAGMRKPLTAKGWTASPIRDETIDGKPFAVFTMSRDGGPPFMLLATTFADNSAYLVQIDDPSGSVENAPELNAIVHSFNFLEPVNSVSRHDAPTGSLSFQLGRLSGFLIGLAVVVFLIKKATRRAK